MPPAIVVSLVVFLLVLAALCGVIAIWTILSDLRAAEQERAADEPRACSPPGQVPAPPLRVIEVPPAPLRATVPLDLGQTRLLLPPAFAPRRIVPPGVPLLPPPLPRGMVHATPVPAGSGDDYEDDYTEVDDGVTIIRDARVAARR